MTQSKKILVLGAGLVAGPLVRYLSDCNYRVTLANRTFSKAEEMADGLPNVEAVGADITDEVTLRKLVPDHDLVISLVPHTHHLIVAEICLEFKKYMVTTSYIKPEMMELLDRVTEAGLLFLNEIGLDPGIDHMSAMEIIDRVKAEGGKVVTFSSSCGGLPCPDDNDNPWGYKLSWSPRGVVLAGTNNARFLKDGQEVKIEGGNLFSHTWPLTVEGVGDFEVYTNRDCIGYIELYGLQGVNDMFRGTIRNKGWCALWQKIVDLGYLDLTERDDLPGKTLAELTAELVGDAGDSLAASLASFLRLDIDDEVIQKMKWIGLLSNEKVPPGINTLLDVLTDLMLRKLVFSPGEKDMIILQHRFEVEFPDKSRTILSTMVDYGIPDGDSSMSRTVGLPAAIAADMILQGKINLTGIHGPVHKEVYKPVLERLAQMGLRFEEKVFDNK